MKIKRFITAIVALFVFIFLYEFIVHGVLLTHIYSETPTIWRSQADMISFFPFNVTVMIAFAIWITFIFTRLFKEGGWRNGVRFGIYFGILSGIQAAGAYYYLPISAVLAGYWFIVNFLECLIGGFIIGAIYR